MSSLVRACKYSNWSPLFTDLNRCFGRLKPTIMSNDLSVKNPQKLATNRHLVHRRFLSIGPILRTKDPTDNKKGDNKEYIIKFKGGKDYATMFKEFYSLYGPLFLVNYIAINIGTLASLTVLCYSFNDLTFITGFNVFGALEKTWNSWTEGSSKFLIAYGLYKITMPLRVMCAVFLTKRLAPRFNWFKKTPGQSSEETGGSLKP